MKKKKDKLMNNSSINRLPQLSYKKLIRDPIHGYIQLTQVEYELIQLPSLIRLHNIHQMGLGYLVYPGAMTSRFEHSLGVMNIASKMIYQIFKSSKIKYLEELFWLDTSRPEELFEKQNRIIQIVRLAALLHDIGQGPYSHTTEPLLLQALEENGELNDALDLFNCEKEELPAHEYFSFKMINEDGDVKRVIEESGIKAEEVANLLIKRELNSHLISKDGMLLLRKLISSQLDADRMDYLLRDSHATGVPFGLTDIDRIILHLRIEKDKQGSYHLAVDERALMAIEDMMDARFKMYKWVYNHHLKIAMEELMRSAIESLIEKNILNYQDFHWKTFLEGRTDDNYIYFKIIENVDDWYKGLVDRRYAPISILKRPEDHKEFEEMIEKEMGIKIGTNEIRNKIYKFLKRKIIEISTERLQNESLKSGLEILGVGKPISPYRELNEKERILIFSEKQEPQLIQLTEASTYVKSINEELKGFPSYYISFIVPGLMKNEAKVNKEAVKQLIAKEIIKS